MLDDQVGRGASPMNRAPVVIIGAPRSGTNMLRDVLVGVGGYATWPCDEINLAVAAREPRPPL